MPDAGVWSGPSPGRCTASRAFEEDYVAEGYELADVVAPAAVGIDAGGVEVRAEVGVAGFGVGQQMPDDDQDRPADGGVGFLGAAAGDAPVPLAQEGVGLPGGRRGVDQHRQHGAVLHVCDLPGKPDNAKTVARTSCSSTTATS